MGELIMDRLSFCRENLYKLNEEDLLRVYNLLSGEYGDGEYILLNDMKYIGEIFEMLNEYCLTIDDDWKFALDCGQYRVEDRYICINQDGVMSVDNKGAVLWFVDKKLNGEAMEIVEECLEIKGITNN